MQNNRHITVRISWLICCLSVSTALLYATPVSDKEEEKKGDSQIFLNAASDSQPREVSLGLPTNTLSAVPIYEEGLPVSYYMYQCFPYKSWHGGKSASSTGTMNPMETSMRYGEINYFVSSYNRKGSEEFRGGVSYDMNHFGQHKIDFNITGPIARGWQYSASTYQNFDPSSNHLDLTTFQNRHQFYKGVLSKELAEGRGHIALTYQFVNYMSAVDNYGPFVFSLDGTVSSLNGFRLGIDQYLPSDYNYTIMDFKTGDMITRNFVDGNTEKSHHATLTYDYLLNDRVTLFVRSRYKDGAIIRTTRSLSGIDDVTAKNGYTYCDGTIYEGLVQRRMMTSCDALEHSWMNNIELKGHSLNSKDQWILGLDYQYNHTAAVVSTAGTAHEAKANPKMLYLNGQDYYNFNTSGEYYVGHENKLALYGNYKTRLFNRLDLLGFIRAEYRHTCVESLNNVGDDKSNTRYAGFNVTKGKITNFELNDLNGAFGVSASAKIWGDIGFLGEYIFTRTHSVPFNYGGFATAPEDPSDTQLARVGFTLVNRWVNMTSQLVYISQNNKFSRTVFNHKLTKDANGYPAGYTESVYQPINYGIASLGWTTDVLLTPHKDFSLHLSLTLRDPKYEDFVFEPTFSDGVTERYDFSGRNVTSLHKTEINIDPTYTHGPWRIWITARYISKQYINKTNSLYFAGRWETFGGLSFKINKKATLKLNLINLLNQKGASGTISSADLVEDASGYQGYVMAGTFIRPFTVEGGIDIEF